MRNVSQQEKFSSLPRIVRRCDLAYNVSGVCDCACSTVTRSYSTPEYSLETQAFQAPSAFYTLPLTQDYQVACAPSGNARGDGIAVLNPSALEMLLTLHKEQPSVSAMFVWKKQWGKELVETTIQDFLQLGFLTSHVSCPSAPDTRDSFLTSDETLSIWLHVTDRCNLRCSYCYLPHRPADMALETGKASLEAAFRSAKIHGFRQVKIKYAGGEPLLRFPFILKLQHYARRLAEHHDILLDSIVLSNGTLLTSEIIENLKAHHIRLMLSLDEFPHHQNQNIQVNSHRCYPDGRCSAADAMRAIELALTHELVPDLSITVSGRNVQNMPELVKWAIERDLPFGLNFYREHDRCAACHDLHIEESAFIAAMRSVYRVIEKHLPRRSLLASLLDRANLAVPHAHTCGVGRHYLVFDTEGNVSKCQMQMAQAVASCGDNDPLRQIQKSQIGIQNLAVDQKGECHACEWKYWCAGGCPLAAYRATGRYDAPSPYCKIYKALYPEVIHLEGLRLLSQYKP